MHADLVVTSLLVGVSELSSENVEEGFLLFVLFVLFGSSWNSGFFRGGLFFSRFFCFPLEREGL